MVRVEDENETRASSSFLGSSTDRPTDRPSLTCDMVTLYFMTERLPAFCF